MDNDDYFSDKQKPRLSESLAKSALQTPVAAWMAIRLPANSIRSPTSHSGAGMSIGMVRDMSLASMRTLRPTDG